MKNRGLETDVWSLGGRQYGGIALTCKRGNLICSYLIPPEALITNNIMVVFAGAVEHIYANLEKAEL